MVLRHRVPSQVDPTALVDLLADCREMPADRLVPAPRRPRRRSDLDIPAELAGALAGFEDYGS